MRIAVPNTLKWLVLLVLLLAGVGGGCAWWFASQGDEQLRRGILEHFGKIAPRWDVRIGRARFDWNRRVHLHDFSVRLRGEAMPLVQAPEVVVTLDADRLAENVEIDIRRVDVRDPQASLIRHADGSWNWQKLFPLDEDRERKPLAEWNIEGGTAEVRFEHGGNHPAGRVAVQRLEARLVPSGRRQFRVRGTAQIDRAGGLSLDGRWNVDAKTWEVDGRMTGVAAGPDLLDLLAGASAAWREKVADLRGRLDQFARQLDAPEPALPAAGSREAGSSPPELGVTGLLDVTLHVAQSQPGAPPEFRAGIDLRDTRLTNPALPFSLHAIEGRVEFDADHFRIRRLTARNGVTQIALGGQIDRAADATPARFDVSFANLLLDDRLRRRLPLQLHKLYDSLSPSGIADGRVAIVRDANGEWKFEGLKLAIRDGTVTHEKFPYTATQVAGALQQYGDVIELDFAGRAGKRPVTVTGYIRGFGPESEAAFDIRTAGLLLDETFREACPEPVQKTLDRLKLQGAADGRCVLVRAANSGRKFDVRISADVRNGVIEYADFPWRISDIQGEVAFSSEDGTWRFSSLEGAHGAARIAGAGAFRKTGPDDPGRLDLALNVVEAQFDKDLELALPPPLVEVWRQFSPQGKLDCAVTIGWTPGEPPVIELPKVSVADGAMRLRTFPYPLQKVSASGSWKAGRFDIASFSAEQGTARVRLDGHFEQQPNGEWKIRLERCFVDDLSADRQFRRALPEGLRAAVEGADPQKPLSLAGMLEFRGTGQPGDAVTAAWNVRAVLSGNRLTAGVELEKAHGRVTSRGTWDGESIRAEGEIDLDSADLRGAHFTRIRGPYRMIDDRLVVGSPKAFLPNPPAIPPEERLTARFIDGTVLFDSQVDFVEPPRGDDQILHHTKIVLAQGKLEEYARRHLADARNLQGVMNGWLDLRGRGSTPTDLAGRGQLRISPAAVYELPIIAQIFKVLSFNRPDRTAFNYVLVDYEIDRGRFVFDRIDLVGDAISLRGRGTARFDGRLALDFYSMLPRNQIPIPLVGTVLGQVTQGWVGVEVRGTMGAPVATVKAVPELDNALKQFLNAFEAMPRNRPMQTRPAVPPRPPRAIPPRRSLPLETPR